MRTKLIYFFKLIPGLFLYACLNAAPSPLVQTQTKLKNLDARITTLNHSLSAEHQQHRILDKELSNTEKQIGEGVRKLRIIQGTMNTNEQKITQLQEKVAQLNQQVINQRKLLGSHLRARYQMGEYQPLKWLINQDDPSRITRILTYYQYMIKSRQQLIQQTNETTTKLNENKKILADELSRHSQIKQQISQQQEHLLANKRFHNTLIHSLDTQIQSQQHSLQEAQKNKNNLSALLHSLSRRSEVVTPGKSFIQMRRKLPFPIQTAHRSLQRMNQGVTFFADEGTIVSAVYPGKVVFSDWLKGYGLLLIIDHGQGFMTLYAHNQSLFKRTGQMVNQSEPIASVGHTGGIRQNGLYFEIRVKGKAVPPLSWL